MKEYDVIVIGAGHAGCEAAAAASRLGAATLLITLNADHIAQMSCNPAVGGIAKGQVVREIDALGGMQGIITDCAAIQFRLLNQTKGPAVWSPRSQCDKVCYQRAAKLYLELQSNLDILQAEVTAFCLEDGELRGIVTHLGEIIRCRAVVVTTGTFLSGKLHYGLQHFPGGRAGDPPSYALADALRNQMQIRLGRLKTGTPPRILAKTIDFSAMPQQVADCFEEEFSFWPTTQPLPKARKRDLPCYMVYSTEETAGIVRDNLMQAPLYQGKIEGIGTRYCPSFEDKVVRFPHHPCHLLYLEPEGEYTREYYINGISTSLPPAIQQRMIHSIPGMANAVITRYAYAIEYDFIFPDQLNRTLALKRWPNFFSAGQINGTSGYEEAAGQGLLAGANAARYAAGRSLLELSRDTSYIGVMVDDLVTKDIIEPYRLFTSRAEYRLHLRQDNADLRLSEFAFQTGLLPLENYRRFAGYRDRLDTVAAFLKQTKIDRKSLWQHLKTLEGVYRPDTPLPFAADRLPLDLAAAADRRLFRQLLIQAHYEGYLQRESISIDKLKKLESWRIPPDFDYDAIDGLSNESRLKLKKIVPSTLAQAERIDGVTPPEVALLQIHLSRLYKQTPATINADHQS